MEEQMIKLYDKETGKLIGEISEAQLQFLIDELVEETKTDQDYYIDGPTLELLEGNGAEVGLIELLKKALGDRPEMEVEWKKL
jgi:processive 1,2-diacylglycerol beta-glucosyltransferase